MNYLSLAGISLLIFLPSVNDTQAEESQWKRIAAEDGLIVYMNTQNPQHQQLKLSGRVPASLTSLVAVLADTKTMASMAKTVTEVKELQRMGEFENVVYQYMDIPFPLQDRDTIVHNKLEQNVKDFQVRLLTRALPDYLPTKEDVIRIPFSETEVLLTPISATSTDVEMRVSADLGGSVPDWLLRQLAVGRTVENIQLLVEKANQPPFLNATLSSIRLPEVLTEKN